MYKRFLAMLVVVLLTLNGWAENVILIEHNDGKVSRFVFDSEAEISYTSSNLIIVSNTEQAIFDLTTLHKATFQIDDTAIDEMQTVPTTFFLKNNTIVVENAPANALMQIYAVSGRCIGKWHTDSQGTLLVNMNDFRDNIYIVTLNGITYKIVKQ